MPDYPALPSLELIKERLEAIFPAGTPNRNYCTRDIAVKTVFVMLYTNAVEGTGIWVRPNQIVRMTDADAKRQLPAERRAWYERSLSSKDKRNAAAWWYADNTREPIRDETIKESLIPTGAIVERQGLPTTSPRPRYALGKAFADLFRPDLKGKAWTTAVTAWREAHLSAGALMRTRLLRASAVETGGGVRVRFPNGQVRDMAAGPSSEIAKSVLEEFALATSNARPWSS